MGRSGFGGYLVPKRLVNIRSQLSSPPLPLQLHGSRRSARPDAATSVWKTRPRRGHRQQHPPAHHDPPRPPLPGCDLRSPRAAAHLHLTRPQAILQRQPGGEARAKSATARRMGCGRLQAREAPGGVTRLGQRRGTKRVSESRVRTLPLAHRRGSPDIAGTPPGRRLGRARPGRRGRPGTLHRPGRGGLPCRPARRGPRAANKRPAGRAPRLASPRERCPPGQACPAHAGPYPEPRPSQPQPGRRARGAGSEHAADGRPPSPRPQLGPSTGALAPPIVKGPAGGSAYKASAGARAARRCQSRLAIQRGRAAASNRRPGRAGPGAPPTRRPPPGAGLSRSAAPGSRSAPAGPSPADKLRRGPGAGGVLRRLGPASTRADLARCLPLLRGCSPRSPGLPDELYLLPVPKARCLSNSAPDSPVDRIFFWQSYPALLAAFASATLKSYEWN